VVWRDVEGELVLFDEASGRYHALNPTGSQIWRRLAGGAAPELIVRELTSRYDAPAEVVADEVAAFIDRAVDLRLLCMGEP
jgi:PqqD family protein of HPr-rel-A system